MFYRSGWLRCVVTISIGSGVRVFELVLWWWKVIGVLSLCIGVRLSVCVCDSELVYIWCLTLGVIYCYIIYYYTYIYILLLLLLYIIHTHTYTYIINLILYSSPHLITPIFISPNTFFPFSSPQSISPLILISSCLLIYHPLFFVLLPSQSLIHSHSSCSHCNFPLFYSSALSSVGFGCWMVRVHVLG